MYSIFALYFISSKEFFITIWCFTQTRNYKGQFKIFWVHWLWWTHYDIVKCKLHLNCNGTLQWGKSNKVKYCDQLTLVVFPLHMSLFTYVSGYLTGWNHSFLCQPCYAISTVSGSSNSVKSQDWFFRASLVTPRGFKYNTTQNLNGNRFYKGTVKHRSTLGCLDQYMCRGISLWNSWDHEVV